MPPRSEPNPLGKLLIGGLVVWLGWGMGRMLDALADPVTAIASGFLMFMGAMLMLFGVFDLLLLIGLYIARRRAEKPTGIYGTASFATLKDCANAGLTDPAGIFLGMQDGVPLFYSGKSHGILVAPARAGKGISFVVPNLLHYQGSMLVTDPKGELAAITGKHRAQIRAQGHLSQPVGPARPAAKPLQPACGADRAAERSGAAQRARRCRPRHCRSADPRTGRRGQEPVFPGRGAQYPDRSLAAHGHARGGGSLHAAGALAHPQGFLAVRGYGRQYVRVGRARRHGRGLWRRAALSGDKRGRQFADFRTGASNALQVFQPGGPLADAVSGADMSFADLKDRRTTVYLMIPAEKIAHYGPWVALIVRQAIDAVSASHKRGNVLFLLDEFANMGKLSGLAENLTLLAGHGVRIWTVVQDLLQLQKVYGRETMKIILSQSEVMQFFAVRDQELARQISSLLGDVSIMTRNYNLGRSVFDEIGESLSERGIPLMSPQEIRGLDEDKQLIFVKSAPPVLADKVPYWRVEPWKSWAGINPYEGGLPAIMPGSISRSATAKRSLPNER